jgi:CRISPR-associated protein Csy3
MAKLARLPTFLNYPRSISPSEGLMFGLVGDREVPIAVVERTVRGSISSYEDEEKIARAAEKAKKAAKGPKAAKASNDDAVSEDAPEADDTAEDGDGSQAVKRKDTANANIQRIDVAHLPPGASHLVLRFSMVFQGLSQVPHGCNSTGMRNSLIALASAFREKRGYRELAERYAWNLINGRVLWRNRIARGRRIEIALDGAEPLVFQDDRIGTFTYPGAAAMPDGFETLASANREGSLFAEVRIVGALPSGAEVYPSQSFIEKEAGAKKKKEGEKTKLLSSQVAVVDGREVRQAVMHSQKIGNAIRTIDEWHPQTEEFGAVAVEAYGYVQHAGKVVRQEARKHEFDEQGVDLYELLKDVEALTRRVGEAKPGQVPSDALYAMANLVKGGVFSGSKEVKEKADA